MHVKHTLLSLALLSTIGPTQLATASGGLSSNGMSAQQAQRQKTSLEALSVREEADILYMREEEKFARDVYTYLYELWSHMVFSNISESEQRHMDSMAALVDTYGLTDPVQDDSVGVFTDPDLAALFIDLTTRGQASLLEALKVGAFIEEMDMRDIQAAIENAGHADIIQTYENLLRGSRNHLRAFVRTIENTGVVYEAQVLSQSEVDVIVDSPVERAQ